MFFVALVVGILALVFLLLRREYIYSAIIFIIFLVAIHLTFKYNIVGSEPIETVLWIDSSQSMKGKMQDVKEIVSQVKPDSVRFFGYSFNNPDRDFKNFETNKLNIIVSDFLFDIPTNIVSENTVFVPVSTVVKTNHLIKKIYFTNISQIDYLNIELLAKSTIKIYGNNKVLYQPENISTNYIIPVTSLPEEVFIQSVSTNIASKTKLYSDIGVLWFDLNPDFSRLSQVIKAYSLKCEYFLKVTKSTNFYFDKKFKGLIVGYPSGDVRLDDLVDITEMGGRVVVVSPYESFVKKIFRVSTVQNPKVSTSSFLYLSEKEIFELVKGYEGVVDLAFRYQYPIVELDNIETLDRDGYSVYFRYKGVEFLVIMLGNISKFDKQLAKEGVVYSFSEDIYGNILKFVLGKGSKGISEVVLSESAFEGGIIPQGKVVLLRDLQNWVKTNYKPRVPTIVAKEENISQWWILMLVIVSLLAIKWIFK